MSESGEVVSNGESIISTLWVLFLFVATGVASPLFISLLQSNGACESSTLLFVLPNYIGMAASVFAMGSNGGSIGYTRIAENHAPQDPPRTPERKKKDIEDSFAITDLVDQDTCLTPVSSPSRSPHNPILDPSSPETSSRAIPHLLILLLCILDVISASMNFTGLLYAGSAIFTVVYSSMTMYTAVFSWIILNRSLRVLQWVGIWVIVVGLSLTSVFVPSTVGPEVTNVDKNTSPVGATTADHLASEVMSEASRISLGIFLVVCGSLFHSLSYILSEIVLTTFKESVTPVGLSTTVGFFGCAVFGAWQIIYTMPRFQLLVIDEIAKHNGVYWVILICFIVLVCSSLVHAVCFFSLIQRVGSTTTGVLKGVQSVLVFVLSHYFFCNLQPAQCFTELKGVSLGLVLMGVFLYSYFQEDKDVAGDQSSDSDSKIGGGSGKKSREGSGNSLSGMGVELSIRRKPTFSFYQLAYVEED